MEVSVPEIKLAAQLTADTVAVQNLTECAVAIVSTAVPAETLAMSVMVRAREGAR